MNVLDAITAIAATLPDPGSPVWATLGCTLGAFVGMGLGRALRCSGERARRIATDGTLVGGRAGHRCVAPQLNNMWAVDTDRTMNP
jgi:hypothetical protein